MQLFLVIIELPTCVFFVCKLIKKTKQTYLLCNSGIVLQTFYFQEINKGIAGLGEYSIASAYKDIQVIPIENIPTYSPEEIVTNL